MDAPSAETRDSIVRAGDSIPDAPLAPPQTAPLSFAQRRLWFLHQVEPENPRYNMASVVRLTGPLNVNALVSALNRIVERHEILRTRLTAEEGEPLQIVELEAGVALAVTDLTAVGEPDRQRALDSAIAAEVNRPFDLSRGPLLRCTLAKLDAGEHALIVIMHHIISDEWSFTIFHNELVQFYTSLVTGTPSPVAELPIQYGDYADWQHEWLRTEAAERQLAFWKEQLRGNPSGVELPTDRPRRAGQTPAGAARWIGLGAELSERVKMLARSEGATPFMVLLAAFKALLHRCTKQDDLIVGSPVAGRNQIEMEPLIGFFVNTLPLRSRISGGMTFREALAAVRNTALAAYSHQDLPFEKVVEALQPERAINRTPFINVMFFIQHEPGEALAFPGLKAEFLDPGMPPAKFDLILIARPRGEQLIAAAQYDAALFDAETIDRFLEHYVRLLAGAVENPALRVADLPLVGEAERQLLVSDWNATRSDYPRTACVHELFEEQVRKRPDAVAVRFGGASLSYRALNEQANQLAHYLRQTGVTRGSAVALCAERSLEMLVAVLGILKSGAAYAPIDPGIPGQRMAGMMGDLQPRAVVASHRRLADFAATAARVPMLCLENALLGEQSRDNPAPQATASDVAYLSFTSGSAGRPKGVCVPHRAIVRLVRNTNYARFDPSDVFLQFAPLAFDASTFEIWGSLLNGATLAMMPPELPSLDELAHAIERYGVTTAWFTSGLFNQIVDERPELLKKLRQVLAGGDVLSPAHVRQALAWLGSGALINGYGPTENATFTACYRVPPDFDGKNPVPIGRPIANTTCLVLDENLRLAPIGVPGELYTGGDGLATGYLNDPDLTAKKFVPHPFQPGERLYRTGDLVRWRGDGVLEFIGRNNGQVKIRGFRVETGEVEAALLEHPSIQQAAVVSRTEANGAKQLAAYFVPRSQPAPDPEELRRFLAERLPDYMIPGFILALGELPLSRNGKIDRGALPEPRGRAASEQVAEPRNELETQLRALWQEVLDVRPIGIHDRFFALGGHSLLAIRLVALIGKKVGTPLKVATLFQHPTIAGLAAVLRGGGCSRRSSLVEIQSHGTKPPLFLVHGAGGGMLWGYGNLARHLGADQPVFAFQSRGMDGEAEPETVEELARTYVADLRSFQAHGPYRLGGYCFGGVVAFEMSRQLQAAGERVEFLGLINSTAPNSRYTQFAWTPRSAALFVVNILRRIYFSLRAHPEALPQFLRWKWQAWARSGRQPVPIAHAAGAVDADDWVDLSQYNEQERRIWRTHLQALCRYRPKVYPGRVWLFRSAVHLLRCSFDADYGWSGLAGGGLVVRVIGAAHEAVMKDPGVRGLAAALTDDLAGTQREKRIRGK